MQYFLVLIFLIATHAISFAQIPASGGIQVRLPQGTIVHGNIPYNNDTLKKHLLDIYIPANAKGNVPFVVFIHGGGWISNDKYADMGYMPNTITAILNNGIAIASIDYRYAMQAVFPKILQDCNRAVSFLYDNAVNMVWIKQDCRDGLFIGRLI